MRLNRSNFQLATLSGKLTFPSIYTPFINVDPSKYATLEKGARKPIFQNLMPIRRRYGKQNFHYIRNAISNTWQCAMTYFPAYRFQVIEYLNDEWLASVDFHKGFHRDHVSHQVFTYYVARTLLIGKDLSEEDLNFNFTPGGKTLQEHMLDVILNGDKGRYLLMMCQKMGAPKLFWKDPHSSVTRYLWSALIDETLCLACYFHDIGYPWQFVNHVDSSLQNHHPIANQIFIENTLWESFRKRLIGTPFNGYEDTEQFQPLDRKLESQYAFYQAIRETHGLPGAIAFLHLNDILRKFPDPNDSPIRRFCLEWAAMSIMMHDLQKSYDKGKQRHLRIDFARDPMSFLLTLADQIQDFDRPNSEFQDFSQSNAKAHSTNNPDKKHVSIGYKEKCSAVELDWEPQSNQLTINYCFRNIHDYIVNRDKYKKDAWQDYFDPVQGYLDYSSPTLNIKSIKLEVKLDKS